MLAALEESVGRQRRLVADASHELRTPLTAARTNVDLVREGKLPEEEVRHALDEASTELDSLTSLVSDLVELARGEERKLRIEDVQLDDLVDGRGRAGEGAFARGDVRHVAGAGSRAASIRCSSSARSGTCSTTRSSTARPVRRSR